MEMRRFVTVCKRRSVGLARRLPGGYRSKVHGMKRDLVLAVENDHELCRLRKPLRDEDASLIVSVGDEGRQFAQKVEPLG
jgi:hypothetical protein